MSITLTPPSDSPTFRVPSYNLSAEGDGRVMIHSVTISNYRTFDKFEMSGLGRINLLVGRNNIGKSSILEGLYLLASGTNPAALWYVLARRGEQLLSEQSPNRMQQADADVSHLFHGHEITAGSVLSISTTNDKPGRSIQYRIDLAKPEESPQLFASLADEGIATPRLALWVTGTPEFAMPPIPLSRMGSLRIETLQQFINTRQPRLDGSAAQFVTTESFSVQQISQLWNTIVLTADEDRVIRGLKLLEERIERIAQAQTALVQMPGVGFALPTRGGFFVRLAGEEKRLPIGSFGDGIWRMLALVVALVRAKDNLLLVDEIDTGLHYTVMADMWRLISEAAVLFNVQVFATTHSHDCVHSLAALCAEPDSAHGISIQRIEANRPKAIALLDDQVRMIAERNIEVR